MKNILLALLLSLNLSGSDTIHNNYIDIELIKQLAKDVNTTELFEVANDYINNLASQDANLTGLTHRLKSITTNAIDKLNDKLNHFNVKEAQSVTYEVKVTTTKDINASGTAVALTSDGKLITAYHNIDSYKSVEIIDKKGKVYPVKIGKISAEHDLAYLHIDVKNIPYAKLAKEAPLGQDVYMLSFENLLLTGIISQVKEDSVLLNVEAKKGTSGGAIFNSSNELVSILLRKDKLNNTSFSARHNTFKYITQPYIQKLEIDKHSNNYDTSYCYDENDLKIWNKYAESEDEKVQELHALFLGLCIKVEKRNLTTDEAQHIFENTKNRLFG